MTITTLKRCQSDPDWWYTVEDCNVELGGDPGSGLSIRCFDNYGQREGKLLLSIGREDAIMIRDAINQLYPPSECK